MPSVVAGRTQKSRAGGAFSDRAAKNSPAHPLGEALEYVVSGSSSDFAQWGNCLPHFWGGVVQWQMLTTNPEKLERFYSSLFGWKVSADNPLGHKQVSPNCAEGIHGGFWPISANEGHSLVQLFIRVEDLRSHVKKAQDLGARIVVPPPVLPGGDQLAIAVDPDGIPFGMVQGSDRDKSAVSVQMRR